MPIYELLVPGSEKPRMIKAKDAAAALTFAQIVTIKPASAERMMQLMEEGVALEKAPDATDPATHAPGGALHKPDETDSTKGGKGAGGKSDKKEGEETA